MHLKWTCLFQSVSLTGYCLDLLNSFVNTYETNVCFKEIFNLTNVMIKLLSTVELYPKEIKNKLTNLLELFSLANDNPKEFLKCMNKKPVVAKLHEPKIIAK